MKFQNNQKALCRKFHQNWLKKVEFCTNGLGASKTALGLSIFIILLMLKILFLVGRAIKAGATYWYRFSRPKDYLKI
jgi:fumarate reductase subunit C